MHHYICCMTNFIPVFPLGIVTFPNEQLNLHIFEPKYKQLITDCNATKKPFGIPVVINDVVQEFGTLVEIEEIAKAYDDGRMDIKTRGKEVFRVLEIVKTLPDKLYNGAIVTYPANLNSATQKLQATVIKMVKEMHDLIDAEKDFKKKDEELLSYDVAHHVGLTVEEEYDFLLLMTESQRLEYLRRHLKKMITQLSRIEKLRKRISMNGHFKELKGFNFE